MRTAAASSAEPTEAVLDLALTDIEPDPEQPRRLFAEDDLAALADSLRTTGLVQPIVVVPNEPGAAAGYRILVGERRWRAAQRAGLATIRATVRHEPLGPADRLMLQLTENDDRAPLTLYERALAAKKALGLSGLTKRRFAAHYRKSPSWTSTLLFVAETEGHAREALEADLLRHADTVRLFAKLPEATQARMLARARDTGNPITMNAVQTAIDRHDARSRSREEAGEFGALAKLGPPPRGDEGEELLGPDENFPYGDEPELLRPDDEDALAPVATPTFGRRPPAPAAAEPGALLPLNRKRVAVLFDLLEAEPDSGSLDDCATQLAHLLDQHNP